MTQPKYDIRLGWSLQALANGNWRSIASYPTEREAYEAYLLMCGTPIRFIPAQDKMPSGGRPNPDLRVAQGQG